MTTVKSKLLRNLATGSTGHQQVPDIAKQAAAYYLEQGTLGTVDADCSDYVGTIKDDNTILKYDSSSTRISFAFNTTDTNSNYDTKHFVLIATVSLTDRTFEKPVASGVYSKKS